MNADVGRLIDSLAALHVLVIGDAMLDTYLQGSTDRLCPEAPVPVVAVSARRDMPGGAANTAVHVRSLGAQVRFLPAVGGDAAGMLLGGALDECGVGTYYVVRDRHRRTLVKNRIVANSQLLVRFDEGSPDPVEPRTERILSDALQELMPRCDAVIVSDYGYGVLTPCVVDLMQQLQAKRPRTLIVDSKRQLSLFQRVGAAAVKPNYAEDARLLA